MICTQLTPEAADSTTTLRDISSVLLQALQEAPAPMVLTDNKGVIRRVNAAFEQITGYSAAELRGKRPNVVRSGLQSEGFYRGMWVELARSGSWQGEVWNKSKDGRLFQEYLSIVALRDSEGTPAYYLGMYTGLANPLVKRARITAHGETDAVTGLPSRCTFVNALQRLGEQVGYAQVFVLDIDGFTEFNEQHGLACGDSILRQVALRCTKVAAAAGGRSIVGRVGPDEFALGWAPHGEIGAHLLDDHYVQQMALELRAALEQPYDIGAADRAVLSVSIGAVALLPGRSGAAEALLHASAARQMATPGMALAQRYEVHESQRRLAMRLRQAISDDQVDLHYQPKINLRTGRLAGLEGLARWTLADGTSVPPGEFIALAEQHGLIATLGDRLLERALSQIGAWQQANLQTVPVAVNFSALQFRRIDVAKQIGETLTRYRVPGHLLELELTESVLIGVMESVIEPLNGLRALGVRLSIDDFGTGYSSLAYLRRFPVNALKIDRQFVSEMEHDASAHEVARFIVDLAHRLGLSCVAEGIETPGQLQALRSLGCDEGQGFLLAHPMPPNAVTRMLEGGDANPWDVHFLKKLALA
jgi:PAS domain S-box-containing protein/diguanylate cyclase (GGDEF)-like protein